MDDLDGGDNYGRLDQLGTMMFIPKGVVFEPSNQFVEGASNIKLAATYAGKKQVKKCKHPGGTILYLRETTPTSAKVPGHFPFTFAVPSIVTFTQDDYDEMQVDLIAEREDNAGNWPGMEMVVACPVCRAKAKPDDGKKEYVLCTQTLIGLGKSSSEADSQFRIAMKLFWRLFCVPCFSGVSLPCEVKLSSDPQGPFRHVPFIDLVREGAAGPFAVRTACPAFDRCSDLILTGFMHCLGASMTKHLMKSFGQTGKLDVVQGPAGEDKLQAPVDMARFKELCDVCGRGPTKAQAGSGGKKDDKPKLARCGRCGIAKYCSRACQAAAWTNGHKAACKPASAAAPADATPAVAAPKPAESPKEFADVD